MYSQGVKLSSPKFYVNFTASHLQLCKEFSQLNVLI